LILVELLTITIYTLFSYIIRPVVTSTTIGSTNITQTPPTVTKETKYPDGVYKVTIPIKPTTQGQHEVCVKLQQPAG
jgi:hypothetical protein